MNHCHTDQTGLGPLQTPLWEYMAQNWAPRGAETARLLYNASGWVVHNEMNIFGHTGMKGDGDISSEIWANYPIAAAWMMQHVFDNFDYNSQDVAWLRSTGYPMLNSISQFWLSQL
ncbi:Alpha-fucosidase A [Fulvia fulva]|uniref:Alpha-fucosidase A n=1 Tax=Passalora fulva TaxID=5499 RepID=A0A9Q8PJA4_PASFU|nr:Alpha-fucosidase A [Fulvia fulva]KAK4611832.1 Alpha-fucosidase A [Fulvia fulva]KAK4612358.1 Alpha-fucosidase A [Fulvia fulva]UJO23447.1 Alpha-fucosidase A [Fulvia fulva]WPV21610.1 Alpha-fucosidase A [Fulvia fulva]WPV36127.1 Alpha-fucosidase A [Fulvia fulva]